MPRSAASLTKQSLVALVVVSVMGCGQQADEADGGSGAENPAPAPAVRQAAGLRPSGPSKPSPECDALPAVSKIDSVMPNETKTIALTAQSLGAIAHLTVPQGAVLSTTTFTLSVPHQTKRVVVDLEARDANGPVTTFQKDLELRLFIRSSCKPQGPPASGKFVIYKIPAPGDTTLTGGDGVQQQNGNGNHVTRPLRSFSGYIVAEG